MLTLTPQLVTRYHISIATIDWLRDLESHVVSTIASHPEYHTTSGCGTVSSGYNEERFMGPLSLIKNDFNVVVRVNRRFSFRKDQYEMAVRYVPESKIFETLRETVETIETKRRDKRNHRFATLLAKEIRNGWEREIADNWRCPWCDAPVGVSFHPSGTVFHISCPNGHFGRYGETDSPPDWWRDAITGNWIE